MSKYCKEIVEDICKLIKTDSFTIPEICKKVGIDESTYHLWRNEKVDFLEAIKAARKKYTDSMLATCEKSLSKLIEGFEYEELRTVSIDDGSGKGKAKIKEQTRIKKQVIPNLGAIIHYQTNNDPDNWKNRQSSEVKGKIEIDSTDSMTPEQIRERTAELIRKANAK